MVFLQSDEFKSVILTKNKSDDIPPGFSISILFVNLLKRIEPIKRNGETEKVAKF